jgi:glycosyltransferase involved in cell wall biosynthesis
VSAPIRVLYDISPVTLGGTERFLGRFLSRLDRRRFAPMVVAKRDGPPLQLIRSLGVPVFVVPSYDAAPGVRRVADIIHRNRIRLAQSNYYSFTLGMAASLAGIPHVWRPGGHVSHGSGVRSARDAQLALEMMRLLSTTILCNSRFVAGQFLRDGGVPVHVIPNGISPRSWERQRRSNLFRIGMVAHLTPQKRHVDFIRAARRVVAVRDDVAFVIYGRPVSGPESRLYGAGLRREARDLMRHAHLTISAFAPGDDQLSTDLDILVLPSIGESFSNAVLEGMAAGQAIIAARSGGNPELVAEGATGVLVPPRRPRALADAMLHLVGHPSHMRAMGRAGRARVRRHFAIETCVARYQDVYAGLVANA